MVRTGKGKNWRTGSLLLMLLFILGLASLALPQAAESGVATAWVRSYNAGVGHLRFIGSPGSARAMVVDRLGNVYVAGNIYKGRHACATIKYSRDGERLWVRTQFERDGEPRALALDGLGNVLVSGMIGYWTGQYSSSTNYATVKYDADGHRLWARVYDGPGEPFYNFDWDEPRGVTVDSQGNVLVTGRSSAPGTNYDYLTIKYSPEGRRLWTRRVNGGYDDGATAVAVDGQGNVYVTGTLDGGAGGQDYGTIKYTPEGRMLWMQRYNGPANGPDNASAVALDAQGNVYVSGWSYSGGSEWNYDSATIKYDTNGQLLWARRHENGGGRAIKVDGQGNVYVISGGYTSIKYNPDGEELWARSYEGQGNGNDYATGMALDAQDNVYVTGTTYGDASAHIATVKYSPEGELLWVMRYEGTGNQSNSPTAIAVDGQGNVYVTGTSVNFYGWIFPEDSFYVTIKYLQSPRRGR